ncbi:MAG TPA: hypothetical protein VNU47_02115 [Candidatus Paceibacterota bacterium]|nr:hypothetical protein [Candidatus Paceibacterota bacterium]
MKYLYLTTALCALLAAAPAAAQNVDECVTSVMAENGWSDNDMQSLPIGQTISYRGRTVEIRKGGSVGFACKELLYDEVFARATALESRITDLETQVGLRDEIIDQKDGEIAGLQSRIITLPIPKYGAVDLDPRIIIGLILSYFLLSVCRRFWRKYNRGYTNLVEKRKPYGPIVS